MQDSPPIENDARWTQTVSVQPNTVYRLSGWAKTENVGHTSQIVDAGANLCLFGDFVYGAGLFDTNDWRLLSLTFNSGAADQVVVCARLGFFAGVTTGTAWFDDLRLVALPGGAAQPTPTSTPSATATMAATATRTPIPPPTNTLPPGAPTYTRTPTPPPTGTPTITPTATGTNTPTPDPVGCCALPNTGICVDSFNGIGPAYCAANNGTWMPRQHCGCGENCVGSCVPGAPPPTYTPTQTPTPDPRFHDNGDGTISDLQTGLMWEKKDRAGGLHDVYALYTWAGLCGCTTYTDGSPGQCTGSEPLCQPDAAAASACSGATGGALGCAECSVGSCNVDPFGHGATTIWSWLAQLNASSFGGHSDWRIPTVAHDGGAAQLETILSATCTTIPCVSPAFNTGCTPGCTATGCSCTASDRYFSATTFAAVPQLAWDVYFDYGLANGNVKSNFEYVRAVR